MAVVRPLSGGADLVLLVEHTMDVYKQRGRERGRRRVGSLLETSWHGGLGAEFLRLSVGLSLWHLGPLN